MSEQRSDARLDELLRRWADSRQENGDLEDLQQRILATCREQTADGVARHPQPAAETNRGLRRRRWPAVWFAAGAVAASVVAMCCYSLLGPDGIGPGPVDPLPSELAWLQESELAEKLTLANEMERLFGDRFRWIGETNDRVLLEVGESDTVVEEGSPRQARLAVRVVAVRRNVGEERWTPVWAADVVTRQEQVVRFAPDPAGSLDGVDFAMWAYAVEDGVIAIDSELSLGELSLRSTFNGLQRSGIPLAVHEVEQDTVQYRVFQTVVILDGEA
jgi:hypothetical protein